MVRSASCKAVGVLVSLTASAACTYKVDLLSTPQPNEFPTEFYDDDASIDALDAYDPPPDVTPPEPLFPICEGMLAPDAGTGEPCTLSVYEACVRGLDSSSCSIDTAICQEGVLRLGRVERASCEFSTNSTKCAEPSTPCCIRLRECGKNASSLRQDQEVCAPGCDKLTPQSTRVITECPGAAGTGWPGSDPTVGCSGDFVCDSLGFPLGPDRPFFATDRLSLIYWCEHGVLQKVSVSDLPFWQGAVAL